MEINKTSMKKIIITALALIMAVSTVSSTAVAASSFNAPGLMPTVTVTNATTHPCSAGGIDGCWQTHTTAVPGDVIAVHIYYKNTSNVPAVNATLSIQPSRSGTAVSFYGGVASDTVSRATGTATATLSQVTTFSYMDGQYAACWEPSATSGCRSVNADALFGTSGFSIGTVNPGEQGTLVARFRVNGVAQNTTYQCNDGIDNDGDGYTDYPSDPGCSSATDDSEYNAPVNNNQCQIDSFNASPSTIMEGNSSQLSWDTSDCSYVTLTNVSGNLSADGNRSVSPSSTTTYTLRAYNDNGTLGGTDTRTVTVNQQQNQSCRVDDFYASPTTIDRGDTSTLRWSTSGGVDYVTISGLSGNRSEDGSVSVSPYSTQSYSLRAYCNNGNSATDSVTVSVRSTQITTAPQAITTVATVLGNTQARLNGIAVPNTTNSTTSAWFEWGVSGSFGNRTISQTVSSGNNSQYYSDIASGLVPGGVYFYRAVVQNQNGIAYGDTVRFQTTRSTTPSPVIVNPTPVVHNVVVAQSAPSLLKLSVESNYDRMCINGQIDYTITYENISTTVLQKAVLQFNHPKELTYLSATGGHYEVVDRTMTIDLGEVQPGERGIITVHARVNETALSGNLTVATATVVYTNARTHAQEDAIAYSLITVSNDCPSLLGASVFGFGSFLPSTLIGWLLLILVIFALIVLGRQLYKKTDHS